MALFDYSTPYYLRKAYELAAQHSDDPSSQNAALLVDRDDCIRAWAANHFPRNVVQTPERLERPLRYRYVAHAECRVICWAARYGIATDGLTMYCPWAPCENCAKAIIEAGIARLVSHDLEAHGGHANWLDTVRLGCEMLAEAGVTHDRYQGKLGGVKIRFNYEMIEP
jgi:dCMP deaminase